MQTDSNDERDRSIAKLMQRIASLPKSYQLNLAGETQFLQQARGSSAAAAQDEPHSDIDVQKLRARLQFRNQNYIEDVEPAVIAREQFDVILCLSTVKWVHFNFGDTGLKALFLKVYEQLAPGGTFIFEQ